MIVNWSCYCCIFIIKLVNNDLTTYFRYCLMSFVTLTLMKLDIMKLIRVKRETKVEDRFAPKMGKLKAKVTYVKKQFLGVSFTTLHKYRETYYGEVKDCQDCQLAR